MTMVESSGRIGDPLQNANTAATIKATADRHDTYASLTGGSAIGLSAIGAWLDIARSPTPHPLRLI